MLGGQDQSTQLFRIQIFQNGTGWGEKLIIHNKLNLKRSQVIPIFGRGCEGKMVKFEFEVFDYF